MEGEGDLRNGTLDNGSGADDKLDALKNSVDGNLDKENSDIGQEISWVAEKLSEAEGTAYALENHNKDLQAQVDELNGQINIAKEERKSLLGEKTQLEFQVGDLFDEIQILKEEIGVLLDERSQLQVENDGLNKKNEDLSRLLEESQGSLDEVKKDRDGLSEKIDSLSNQIEGLVTDNEELKGGISHLGDLVSEKEVLGSSLRKELDSLKEENARLTIQLEEAQKEIGLLREEKGSLQGQLKESRHEISELKAENEKLQKIIDETDKKTASQIEVLKEDCLKLGNEKEKQRNEIELLQAQKESIENELLNAQRVGKDDHQVSYSEGQVKSVHSGERDLVVANCNSENGAKRQGEIVEQSEKLKEEIREFELAIANFQKIVDAKENTIQQLTLEIQALQDSPARERQKSRTLTWSAVIISGALVTASTALICHKYAKRH